LSRLPPSGDLARVLGVVLTGDGVAHAQIRLSVGSDSMGSMIAVVGSGMRSISLSWMARKPRIDEPSKPLPSSNNESLSSVMGRV
jgi:hypothetical protein